MNKEILKGLKSLYFTEVFCILGFITTGIRGYIGSPGHFLFKNALIFFFILQVIIVLPIFFITYLIARHKK